MTTWDIKLLYEPRDLWVGVFVDRPFRRGHPSMPEFKTLHQHIYVCLLPCLPIRITRHTT